MGFRTKLDFSNNRQVSQRIETTTILSGATSFGVPFSQLPSGPNLALTSTTNSYSMIFSTFSGNNTTTVFTWGDSRMSIAEASISAITPSNSAITQTVTAFLPIMSTAVINDGYTAYTTYSGVSYNIIVSAMTDLGSGNYSGNVSSSPLFILSAPGLDFTGRTIWNDISGITRTNRLIVANNPQIGNVLTCVDAEGMSQWSPPSSSSFTGNTSATCITDIYVSNLYGCSPLHINPTGLNDVYIVENGGNVGIGTTSPTQKLFVSGNTRTQNNIDGDVSLISVNTNNGGTLARAVLGASAIADSLGRTLSGLFVVGGYNTDTSGFSFGDGGTGYLKNSLSITVGGNPPRGDINIGTRDSSKFLRFFAGSQDFDSSSLKGSLEGTNGYWGFGQNMTGQTAIVHIKGNGSTLSTNSLKIDNSSNSPLFYVRDDGNIGVGINNPSEKLHVSGNTKISGNLIIQTIGSGTSLINLGIDSSGNVVTGSTTYWSASTGTNAIVTKNSNNLASGNYALAEGYSSRAIGNYSHVQGYSSRAIGHTSHAEGTNTTSGFKSFTLSGSGFGLVVLDSSYGNVVSDFTVNSYLLDTGFNDINQISGVTYDGFNTKIQLYNTGATIYGSTVVDINNLNSNNANIILNTDSHAEGQATRAIGIDSSHAEGSYTIAIGNYGSHAEGRETTAIGQTSHAEGRGTISSGLESHAEGRESTAIGHASHAEGYFTTASGDYSHAEGYYSAAMAVGSHAEGGNPYALPPGSGKGGLAINIASHAEGMLTTAEGIYSHAEGWGVIANGIASHAQGKDTRASGTSSHSSGDNTIADGYCAFVHGSNSVAQGSSTIVLGDNITGTSSNTTYVASLNIKTVGSGAFANDISIDANGNLTTNTSDERLKENIKPITNALNTIKQLNGVNYQWVDRKAGGDNVKLGFIAQQVEIVEPKLVFTNKVDGYKGLHVDGIIPLLVEAVKELSTGVTQTNNSYIETQTILAEDNNVELNYNGTPETALGGGLRVLHAKGQDLSADLITDENGDFVTNNDFKPNTLTIPFFTPTSSNDENGKIGNITRDDNYLYVKTSSGWRRSNLESF